MDDILIKLEPRLSSDEVADHIFELYSTHAAPDNQNLGYISRTRKDLNISIDIFPDLFSQSSTRTLDHDDDDDDDGGGGGGSKSTRRRNRGTSSSKISQSSLDSTIELMIHQSPELLNSSTELSTTGAVVWQVSPLLAEWVLQPGTIFHDLFFKPVPSLKITTSTTSRRDNITMPAIIELGAGISGVLTCLFSLGLIVKPPDVRGGIYVATDQAHILPVLKKNVTENMVVMQDMARKHGRHVNKNWQQEFQLFESNSIRLFEPATDNAKLDNHKHHQHQLHHNHQRQYHGKSKRSTIMTSSFVNQTNKPVIEILELDWERAIQDVNYIKSQVMPSDTDTEGRGEGGFKKEFDIVIACDTVYNDYLIAPFAHALSLLAGPDTHVLIGMQMRSHDVQENFLLQVMQAGFDVYHVHASLLSDKMKFGFAVYYLRKSNQK
ncbi:hypothetical protein V1514DRAFT_326505 [Lipomyces japonicus]|uniref:uncharacterized protein n=1 Tax=Lipomyces japonicus TaxID=56871 RepID=UPI0034CE8E43